MRILQLGQSTYSQNQTKSPNFKATLNSELTEEMSPNIHAAVTLLQDVLSKKVGDHIAITLAQMPKGDARVVRDMNPKSSPAQMQRVAQNVLVTIKDKMTSQEKRYGIYLNGQQNPTAILDGLKRGIIAHGVKFQ